uniref:Nef-associated protein 1 n=2 Tax=Lygus hesperus TaxID=30085 RepID=A0A0A9XWA8_LYGHE
MMDPKKESTLADVMKELKTARNEICNLRKQIKTLKITQEKEVEKLNDLLKSWTCENCQKTESVKESDLALFDSSVVLKPIGVLSTVFPRKRAVPRQPGVCANSRARVILDKRVLSNPEHSLEGLSGFSHMWIIFHFNQNNSKHVHAKVSPPRLGGEKTGVFATRSPHRPCPIGLSLVQIDMVEGPCIYFSGVDMLDGTPVLDIKPYIPQYDDPLQQGAGVDDTLDVRDIPIAPGSPGVCPGHREAPDGEESDEDGPTLVHTLVQPVRVPSWIRPTGQMNVIFTPDAREQMEKIDKSEMLPVIQSVLREDPRSLYVKQRYANQFYTFLISDLHVSCKFDDVSHSVSVYRVEIATSLSDRGFNDLLL